MLDRAVAYMNSQGCDYIGTSHVRSSPQNLSMDRGGAREVSTLVESYWQPMEERELVSKYEGPVELPRL